MLIGKDCMISNNIHIRTTDFHNVVERNYNSGKLNSGCESNYVLRNMKKITC